VRSAVENCLAHVRRAVGMRLEAGRGIPWPIAAAVTRPVALPAAIVVGVGGALLGGSGRTPLALAITASLARRGARVAFVGHGYGGSCTKPTRVLSSHTARDVGDEAALAARRLAQLPVWVGPREATLHAAAARAAVLVVDGLLQTAPTRLALSVLALSAPAPWGSGRVFPHGDLRSTPARLLEATDHVVVLSPEPINVQHAPNASIAYTTMNVPPPARRGLFLSVARPERIVRELARRGHDVTVALRGHDHGAATWEARAWDLLRTHELSDFLVTDKCDAALGSSGLPRTIIGFDVTLPAALEAQLDRIADFAHML
jgi:tetraacyldisaccharide 4'-kinase